MLFRNLWALSSTFTALRPPQPQALVFLNHIDPLDLASNHFVFSLLEHSQCKTLYSHRTQTGMYVCMYVCMYVVRINVFIYVCMYVCMHVVLTYSSMYVWMYKHSIKL